MANFVKFTKYTLPNGRKSDFRVFSNKWVSEDTIKKGMKLVNDGYVFEIEVLRTGMVNMDCQDEDGEWIAGRICKNNEADISKAISGLINEAYRGVSQNE